MDSKTYASDFYCVRCKSQGIEKKADVFLGMADPDATQTPYCNDCCKIVKDEIYIRLFLDNDSDFGSNDEKK